MQKITRQLADEIKISEATDYNSHNTTRLDVAEMQSMLLKLRFMQAIVRGEHVELVGFLGAVADGLPTFYRGGNREADPGPVQRDLAAVKADLALGLAPAMAG